jgi:hypothetical protein
MSDGQRKGRKGSLGDATLQQIEGRLEAGILVSESDRECGRG